MAYPVYSLTISLHIAYKIAITFWLSGVYQAIKCVLTEHSSDALMPSLELFCTFPPLKRKFYLFNAGLKPGTTNVF